MGLTIHYTLKSNQDDARQTVHKMRQLALDLPFEEVSEIVDLKGKQCDTEARRAELQNGEEKNESLFWLMIQAGKHVECPWNKRISRTVNPTRIIAFNTWPGPGSEPADFGLCLYPAEIEWKYTPEDDQRFQSAPKKGFGWHQFDWRKWDRHCKRTHTFTRSPAAFNEMRKVPTKLAGWHWGSFCKTQYATDPECGGIPNFLRCHISVITLLDRMGKLPGVKVSLDDEGKYGSSVYSDDWREADAAGRKRTYRRHKGQYNPAALANEVGEWNTMIAGMAGALSDALAGNGIDLEAPIKDFPDFEQLEFKGRNQKHLAPFLQAMKKLAKQPQPLATLRRALLASNDKWTTMKTFTKTFEIDTAIRWELYKSDLAEALFDRTAADSNCPEEITGSAYTGEVQVKDKLFVVTLTEGEHERA